MNHIPKRKGWFRNLPITTKLSIVLTITALTPLILLSGFNLYNHAQNILERSRLDLEHLAISKAELIDQLIEDSQSAVYVLATDPEVVAFLSDPANPQVQASAETTFQNALDSNPLFEYTYLINPQGNVVISKQLDGLTTVLGGNFADRAYFQQGIAGNEYIDVLVGRTSGRMGFYFSRPVYDEGGNIIGVVIIKLQGQAVTNIINQINADDNDMSAILIDQDGIVVSPPKGYEDWLFDSIVKLSPETEEKVKARFVIDSIPYIDIPVLENLFDVTESGSITKLRGEHGGVVLGYAPVEQLDWVIGINIPPQVLVDRILNLAVLIILTGLLVGLIAIVIAVLVARGITRPINKLAAAAQKVERDQPFEPSDLSSVMVLGDELGHLARVFNKMVQSLRARIADLRTIYEISQEISAGISIDDKLAYILTSIHNVISYDMAEIGFYDEAKKRMVVRATANYLANEPQNAIAYFEPEIARSYPIDEGVMARLLQARGAILINNLQTNQDLELGDERKWGLAEAQSYLGITLRAKNKVIGAIELVSNQPNQFNTDNGQLLASIASQAAIEVQNVQEVIEREQRLSEQIQAMEIVIDEDKKSQQIAHVIEGDFFKRVQAKAHSVRKSDGQ